MGKHNKNNGKQHNGRPQVPPAPPRPVLGPSGAAAQPVGPDASILAAQAIHLRAHEGANEEERAAAGAAAPGIDLTQALRQATDAETIFRARAEALGEREHKAAAAEQARAEELGARERKVEEREAGLRGEREDLRRQRERIEEDQRKANQATVRVEEAERQLKKERDELLGKAERDRTELGRREQALREREIAAEAGFSAERRKMLEALEAERQALRKEISEAQARREGETRRFHEERVAAQEALAREQASAREALAREQAAAREALVTEQATAREALALELRRRRQAEEARLLAEGEAEAARHLAQRKQLADELAAERQALADGQEALRAEGERLRIERQRLGNDQEILREDREDLDTLVAQRAAGALEAAAAQARALEERLQAAQRKRDELEALLQKRQEADRRFGQRSPEEVVAELDALRHKRDELQQKIAARPDELAALRLKELEEERPRREEQVQTLQQELMELRRKASAYRVGAAEVETLRDEARVLESRNQLLKVQVSELRTELDRRIGDEENKPCFPACAQMDRDPAHQERKVLRRELPPLADLVRELRQRIALRRQPLYFAERDLRCFLAGLATSQLLLLQGISGTGKTSLPLAVAEALGAGSGKIEVQAGWRDRDDLIGHYNAFEREFRERPFLQALYEARCPAYTERPYLLVLDEMNLSHPEQYFADVLSALEDPSPRPRLRILDKPLGRAAEGLGSAGQELELPRNVWFIGTANHDETTKDFADKTYDRAHVMELPRSRDAFRPTAQAAQDPLSLEALRQAFDKACQAEARAAEQVLGYLDRHLSGILADRFQIGWGNRLERQVRRFAPVLVAAGGSVAEAADHLLCTKLLRKLRDRYDADAEDLKALRAILVESWKELGDRRPPGEHGGLRLLDRELQRLRSGSEAP